MTFAGADRDERIVRALRPYLSSDGERQGPVLLAVSGGPDSTALMHAAASEGARAGIHVATVDHGLRSDALQEAAEVGALAGSLGLPHRILTWGSPRQDRGIQAAAREARYRLLQEHAAEIGAALVLTAHTADDQAETVLMRLASGSGPTGLAGIRPWRRLSERLWLGRPFLSVPKADLVAYCGAKGLPFRHDPSNDDDRFARTRLRRLLPLLRPEGLTVERLHRLAQRLARDEAALSRIAAAVFDDLHDCTGPAGLALDGERLSKQSDAIALRVFSIALDVVGPEASRHARLERLERLVLDDVLPALRTGKRIRRTLRGVLVETVEDGGLRFSPAPPRRTAGVTSSVAAARSDLLGNDPATAYIRPERVGTIPHQSGMARTPPRISR